MKKIIGLAIFAGVPALFLGTIVYLASGSWQVASIVAGGTLGFGLDMCLRGR